MSAHASKWDRIPSSGFIPTRDEFIRFTARTGPPAKDTACCSVKEWRTGRESSKQLNPAEELNTTLSSRKAAAIPNSKPRRNAWTHFGKRTTVDHSGHLALCVRFLCPDASVRGL